MNNVNIGVFIVVTHDWLDNRRIA